MSAPAPEFSRPERLDGVGRTAGAVRIEADPGEREALRRRFGLEAIDGLVADYVLAKGDRGIMATGRIRADVVQSCVATGAPVPARIDEPFLIRFEPERSDHAPDAEIELDADDCDVVFFAGDRIDMGEAVAETLSLALDPYPRSADADRLLREAGVISEEEAGPFARLRELTRKG